MTSVMPEIQIHRAARVERRNSRRQARPTRRSVEPARRDDDRVLRHRPHSLPRLGDLHDAHARDVRILRMRARQLLARGETDAKQGTCT
jgi:hypothetical protein